MSLEPLAACITGLLLLPSAVLFAEVVSALVGRWRAAAGCERRPSVAVLIPAHNESSVIIGSIRSIKPQIRAADRLIVVADNCTDDTASIARSEGADVIERFDDARRGKGFALDYGVHYLRSDPREVVIIVDADCVVDSGAVDRLANDCAVTGRPVQALYLMRALSGASLGSRIAEFAFIMKNRIRPIGLQNMGLPCQLMGTGMAFGWGIIRDAPLATAHITEDLALGIAMARVGAAPVFCQDARVTSTFARDSVSSSSQRMRWEHGHLHLMLKEGPRLLGQGFLHRDKDMIGMAADLCVPPLALLGMAVSLGCVAALVSFIEFGWALPGVVAGSSLVCLLGAVGLAWLGFGRELLSPANLAFAGIYAILKIPVYAKFIVKRQTEWIRSARDGK